MNIDEVIKKVNSMNSAVEKLDFVYKVFDAIEEKEEAENLIKELKDEISFERATFLPKIELKEPNFEIKNKNIETSIEENELELDNGKTPIPNLSGSVEFKSDSNYIQTLRFKKVKLD